MERLYPGMIQKKEETTEKESVSEEEQEWQNKLMAKVDDFLYVREKGRF